MSDAEVISRLMGFLYRVSSIPDSPKHSRWVRDLGISARKLYDELATTEPNQKERQPR